jgi:hypothetical protein
MAVAYSPEFVTRRDGPAGLAAVFAQQVREGRGGLQVLGEPAVWSGMPSARARARARYQLLAPFLQSATVLLVPGAITVALFSGQPVIVVITLLPVAVAAITLAVELAGLNEFGKLYGSGAHHRARGSDYAGVVLGAVPYSVVLAMAGIYALAASAVRAPSLGGGSSPARDAGLPAAQREAVGRER